MTPLIDYENTINNHSNSPISSLLTQQKYVRGGGVQIEDDGLAMSPKFSVKHHTNSTNASLVSRKSLLSLKTSKDRQITTASMTVVGKWKDIEEQETNTVQTITTVTRQGRSSSPENNPSSEEMLSGVCAMLRSDSSSSTVRIIKRNPSLLIYATSQKQNLHQQQLPQALMPPPGSANLVKKREPPATAASAIAAAYFPRSYKIPSNSCSSRTPSTIDSQLASQAIFSASHSCLSVKRFNISQYKPQPATVQHILGDSSRLNKEPAAGSRQSLSSTSAPFKDSRINSLLGAAAASDWITPIESSLPKKRSVSVKTTSAVWRINPTSKKTKRKKKSSKFFDYSDNPSSCQLIVSRRSIALPSNFMIFKDVGFSRFTLFFTEEFMKTYIFCFLTIDDCLRLRAVNKILQTRVSRNLFVMSARNIKVVSFKALRDSQRSSIANLVEQEIPQLRETIDSFAQLNDQQVPDSSKIIIPQMPLLVVLHVFAIIFGASICGITEILPQKLHWKKFLSVTFQKKTAKHYFQTLRGQASWKYLSCLLPSEVYEKARSELSKYEIYTKDIQIKDQPFLYTILFFVEKILDLHEALTLKYPNTLKYIILNAEINRDQDTLKLLRINETFHQYIF